jgi:hypothetical protein
MAVGQHRAQDARPAVAHRIPNRLECLPEVFSPVISLLRKARPQIEESWFKVARADWVIQDQFESISSMELLLPKSFRDN